MPAGFESNQGAKERVCVIKELANLYILVFKRVWFKWPFYVFPVLAAINPYRSVQSKIIVLIVYALFFPLILACVEYFEKN